MKIKSITTTIKFKLVKDAILTHDKNNNNNNNNYYRKGGTT